jgi:uncharacterized protein (TIGR02444 family)
VTDDFWDYSLKLYAGSGVKSGLLALQNEHGLNVNVLLLCCWHGVRFREALSTNAIVRFVDGAKPWHDGVTVQLRAIRVALKEESALAMVAGSAELRRDALALELKSERIEQGELLAHLDVPGAIGNNSVERAVLTALERYAEVATVEAAAVADRLRHLTQSAAAVS